MLAKLKGTTNIGEHGLVVLYILESSYFVRSGRKECRNPKGCS